MKKQKVLAALLALSMVAANVANAPAFVYADAYVPTQEDGTANGAVSDTTVTLANTVTDGAIVWIDADDSVTVKMEDATVYSKILQKGDGAPASESDFDDAPEADTGIEAINAATKLYLLKTETEDGASITQKQNFILVEVKEDNVVPSITEVTAGGINYKAESDETVYVKDISALQLSAVADDGEGSGIAKIEYVTAGAFETNWNSNSGNHTGWKATVPALASGEYLCVKATDQVGNISYAQTKKFVEDNAAPTISVTDESGELTYDVTTDCPITGAAIKLKAVDAVSGIATAKYCISHGAIANPATDTIESDWVDFKDAAESGKEIGSSEGFDVNDDNYLYVHVVDNAGNERFFSSGNITYVSGSLTDGFSTEMSGAEYQPASPAEGTEYYDLDSESPKMTIGAEGWQELQNKGFTVKTKLDQAGETEYTDNNAGLEITEKGPHTLVINVYDDNDVLIYTNSYNFVNMKNPDTLSLTPNVATYDGTPLGAGHGFAAIEGATYTYYADDQGTNQLTQAPVDAGTYYVKASKPENLATGDKACESAVTEVFITKADVTKSLGTVLVKVDDLAAHEIDTAALLAGYTVSAGAVLPDDASVEKQADNNGIFTTTAPAINAAGNIVYQIASGKAADNTAEILATYSCYKNYTVKLKATIKLIAAETVIKELNVTQAGTTYGTSLPELSYALSDGTVIAEEDRTIAYAKADGTPIGAAMSEAPDAGDYMVTVSYTSTGAIATKTVNFTIAKKPITLTAKSYTITVGDTMPASFEVTSSSALAYTDSYTSEPAATCTAADSNTAGTYAISVNPVTVNADKTGNYAFTYVAGTLTINAAQQGGNGNTNPPSTYEPSTGGMTTKPEDTKKPEDDKKPEGTDTSAQSNEIVVNDHGDKMIVDANGTAVKDAKVVVNGKTYLTDGDGVIITNSFATTTAGNTVFCGKDGAVVKRKMVSVEGKKYYATKTGAIAKDQLVSVEGKKYYATKTGVVAVKKFVTTASGKKVYCSKTGAIVTNKVFTVNGAKYIANKSGVIYKNRWVTKGTKKYYVNKSGKVTKVKTVK